jgi:hypothetical protein
MIGFPLSMTGFEGKELRSKKDKRITYTYVERNLDR